MKKYSAIVMIAVLAISLCACGRKTQPQVTDPMPTVPESTTIPTVIPEIDPTMETNIPDPTVNGNSTDENGVTEETNGMTGDTENGNGLQQDSVARSRNMR